LSGPRLAERAPTEPVATRIQQVLASVIRGKPEAIRLALTTLYARGHLLIEDVPGVGKTTLARSLARVIGGTFHRIQFTSDLLPSDVLGVSVYDQREGRFEFKPGPIFAHVVVSDEINRATPRTQSALLEAMNDTQVSVDGETYNLEQPFMVVATQNPQEPFGTYPLPESQMDRFLLRIRMGYPDGAEERRLVAERGADDPVASLRPTTTLAELRAVQERVDTVRVDGSLLDYVMTVVAETRRSPLIALGVSPRGAIAWYRAAQALALVEGRDYCVPDDLKRLALPALAHRVMLASGHESLGRTRDEAERTIGEILERVPIPE